MISMAEIFSAFWHSLLPFAHWLALAILLWFVIEVIIACVKGRALGLTGMIIAGITALGAALFLAWQYVKEKEYSTPDEPKNSNNKL